MARGGARPGSGRKKGSKNKRTLAREQIAKTAAEMGVTPLEVMLYTMRKLWKNGDSKAACEIAKDVAPYVHPRLSAVETKLDGTLETYQAQPIPVEVRDSDAKRLEAPSAAEAAQNCAPSQALQTVTPEGTA